MEIFKFTQNLKNKFKDFKKKYLRNQFKQIITRKNV